MVVGIIYEATHYAVFSNFLLVSTTKVYEPISTNTVPKPSPVSMSENVTPTLRKTLKYAHTHTHTVYISIVRFPESRKESKTF